MLVEELKPWVDRRYRTQPGREATGIAGSSLGALVSLYLGLSRPEVFGRVGALSIAAWWDERFVVGFVDALPLKPRTRIWLDIGTGEGEAALRDARLVREALLRQGWRDGVDLRYLEEEGARHDEAAWRARAPDVLAFLFPPGAAGR
jgi:predicted alpha/beta superfamily hydrolase